MEVKTVTDIVRDIVKDTEIDIDRKRQIERVRFRDSDNDALFVSIRVWLFVFGLFDCSIVWLARFREKEGLD